MTKLKDQIQLPMINYQIQLSRKKHLELYKSERFQSSAEGMHYNDPAFKAGFWNNEDNSGAGLGSCIGKVGASARKRKVWRLGVRELGVWKKVSNSRVVCETQTTAGGGLSPLRCSGLSHLPFPSAPYSHRRS